MPSIAKVAVAGLLYSYDRVFDYLLPPEFSSVKPGCRVKVGFGKGNAEKAAMILEIVSENEAKELKPVKALIDPKPVLTGEQLELAVRVAERTFCPIYDAIKLMLPSGLGFLDKITYQKTTDRDPQSFDEPQRSVLLYLGDKPVSAQKLKKETGVGSEILEIMVREGLLESSVKTARKVGDKTVKLLSLGPEKPKRQSPKQAAVLKYLEENGESAAKQVSYYTGASNATINTLISKNAVIANEQLCYRESYESAERIDPDSLILNKDQQAAYETLSALAPGSNALLFGVTGSGKTMVILKLVQKTLSEGRSALLMVPEILLTPQFTKLFTGCFGKRVAVLHSGLSEGVRLDEYRRIKNGDADLVIGTRSAIFAPLENIGLISMDEEQESAYKSESSPRYDAGEVAAMRAKTHGALFLRSSATPSIRTWHAAQNGKIALVKLGARYAGARLPSVKLIDMRDESPVAPGGVLGETLLNALKNTRDNGRQSVLLLNRRGHDTIVICYDCGEVIKCPHCSVALNYHIANGRLMCHVCGYSTAEMRCSKCDGKRMRFLGSGIQKVETELAQLLPEASVLRMDTDTTVTRDAHDKLFTNFKNGEYDILIGTQMVAKGIDFENVTLVGVLNAEQGLFSGDYKGAERTFSLLTQVVGRCGRGKYSGEAIIQTYLPENRIFEYARNQDYEAFYNDEIELRRQLLHPPFCDICLIGVSGENEKETAKAADEFLELVKEKTVGTEFPVRAYGPAPAQTARAANRYRYRLTLKCRNTKGFRDLIGQALKDFSNAHKRDNITAFADMNPEQYY
ncbi:MAG TPA: primosomal protein N' [Oscillospiraceae bacterium]|nr:primosomal protein N' [Oscillospiraceae bacterium]HPK35329.1 primosomal protein N' [Oscillospiraceae bacterium]HPR74655.1 primosomal protein N' [Oscillospiraceae bacterium]